MTLNTGCELMRVELSARLDDEIDEATAAALEAHLEMCPDCRSHAGEIERVRRMLRAQAAEAVPDLSQHILARIALEDPAAPRWAARLRIAAVAAVAAAAVLIGASLPFSDVPPEVAAAGDIAREVRRAARALEAYRATFDVTERGWHSDVPVRRFTARIAFRAPESFRLEVRDNTSYPGPGVWPPNDVVIVANARRWWIQEPTTCPTAALPECAVSAGLEERTIAHRQPFDGMAGLPTDIVVPLETLASSGGFDVVGEDVVLGRPTYRVALPYRQAVPLVMSLQAGGSWRTFRPGDRVDVWIDRQTWFPLRFEVTRRGSRLLTVSATAFEEPRRLGRPLFDAPSTGLRRDGGFSRAEVEGLDVTGPAFTADLRPYRAGTTEGGQRVLSYARGMTWLKVAYDRVRQGAYYYSTTAEQVPLGSNGVAYYEPATQSPDVAPVKRRVDVYGKRMHVHLESNLSKSQLLRVASSLDMRGERIPRTRHEGGLVIRSIRPAAAERVPFFEAPEHVPDGYEARTALLSRSLDGRRTVTVLYRHAEAEFDGAGIRITQARPLRLFPPTSESFAPTMVGAASGRWSHERGELEWLEHDVYRAVSAPSFGRATALRIARSLR
ncbi:MAG: zf-HC2 domain-containing protein [Actinomycetota bacterium]